MEILGPMGLVKKAEFRCLPDLCHARLLKSNSVRAGSAAKVEENNFGTRKATAREYA